MTALFAGLSRKALLCCLFICCCNNVLPAQPSRVDSLERAISIAKDDTAKFRLMISLGDAYNTIDQGQAAKVVDAAKLFANRLHYTSGEAISERWIGNLHRRKRAFEDGITHLREAARIYQSLGDTIGLADVYLDLGNAFLGVGRLQAGLDTIHVARSLYFTMATSPISETVLAAQNGVLQTYHHEWNEVNRVSGYQKSMAIVIEYERWTKVFQSSEDKLITLYNDFGLTFAGKGDLEDALEYWSKGLAIANRLNNWRGAHFFHGNIAWLLGRRGEYEEARKHLIDNLNNLNRYEKDFVSGLGQAYRALASIESNQSDYASAIEHYLGALVYYEKAGSADEYASVLASLGNLYLKQSDTVNATVYLNKALESYRKLQDSRGIALALSRLGDVALFRRRFADALAYYSQSVLLSRPFGKSNQLVSYLSEAASMYLQLAQEQNQPASVFVGKDSTLSKHTRAYLDSADVLLRESEEVARGLGDKNSLQVSLFGLGRLEKARGNWNEAYSYLMQASQLADSLNRKKEIYESYAILAEVSMKLSRYDEAYRYHQHYSAYKDSVFNETSSKQIKEALAKYGSDKKDIEIKSLNQDKEIASLKVKQQESALRQATLEALRKESDIKLLNQTKELQRQQLLNANRALTERELEAKAKSAELEAARKDQLLQEHNLDEQRLITYGSMAFALLTVVLGFVLFNRFQLRKELDKRNAIIEERRRISSDMHDDLGSSLSTIALLSQVMKGDSSGQSVNGEVEKISIAAQQSLEKMSEIVWSLNPRNDKLANLVAYIRKYAVEYFENSPVQCGVTMSGTIPDVEITGEQRRNVFLTVKEALHNIVKHSGATRAQMTFAFQDHTLQLSIHDNGKGIDTAARSMFGNGIINMQRRMKEAGGDMAIENKNGTTVKLVLPVRGTPAGRKPPNRQGRQGYVDLLERRSDYS
jgi:two-component system, NarL family, sensor histidine kinase UhpB